MVDPLHTWGLAGSTKSCFERPLPHFRAAWVSMLPPRSALARASFLLAIAELSFSLAHVAKRNWALQVAVAHVAMKTNFALTLAFPCSLEATWVTEHG